MSNIVSVHLALPAVKSILERVPAGRRRQLCGDQKRAALRGDELDQCLLVRRSLLILESRAN
jgi:hypothetical protein